MAAAEQRPLQFERAYGIRPAAGVDAHGRLRPSAGQEEGQVQHQCQGR